MPSPRRSALIVLNPSRSRTRAMMPSRAHRSPNSSPRRNWSPPLVKRFVTTAAVSSGEIPRSRPDLISRSRLTPILEKFRSVSGEVRAPRRFERLLAACSLPPAAPFDTCVAAIRSAKPRSLSPPMPRMDAAAAGKNLAATPMPTPPCCDALFSIALAWSSRSAEMLKDLASPAERPPASSPEMGSFMVAASAWNFATDRPARVSSASVL